jgi:hypothetical protein
MMNTFTDSIDHPTFEGYMEAFHIDFGLSHEVSLYYAH